VSTCGFCQISGSLNGVLFLDEWVYQILQQNFVLYGFSLNLSVNCINPNMQVLLPSFMHQHIFIFIVFCFVFLAFCFVLLWKSLWIICIIFPSKQQPSSSGVYCLGRHVSAYLHHLQVRLLLTNHLSCISHEFFI
jgi:hypothetical protein